MNGRRHKESARFLLDLVALITLGVFGPPMVLIMIAYADTIDRFFNALLRLLLGR